MFHLPQKLKYCSPQQQATKHSPQLNEGMPCAPQLCPSPHGLQGLMTAGPCSMDDSNFSIESPHPPCNCQSLCREIIASATDTQLSNDPTSSASAFQTIPLIFSSGLATSEPGLRGLCPAHTDSAPQPQSAANPTDRPKPKLHKRCRNPNPKQSLKSTKGTKMSMQHSQWETEGQSTWKGNRDIG